MEAIITAYTENWFTSLMFTVGAIWLIAATIESILKSYAHERSRREIAAYVAEGTMTASEGERLLKAGRDSSE